MDRNMARRNMRMGITLFMVICIMLGITFLWAAIYLSTVGSSQ